MRYLITGGAGFIGSHLADLLIEQGHHVHAFDNLSTGRLANVEHLAGHERFGYTVGDVLDVEALAPLIGQADRVVHLAAAVGVRLIMERPVETIVTNVQGTENVLKLCAEGGQRVLVASTSEVYGKAMDHNGKDGLAETDDWTLGATTKRRWAYACSKAMDEFLSLAYHDEMGLDVVVTRFFNTVGPRQTGRYGMVIPNFVGQALRGEPIRVFGDGEQTRCFTYVGDAVRAVAALLDEPAAQGEVFNIGSHHEVSMNELAERVRTLSGSESPIEHVPYTEVFGPGFEDMRRRTPDITKLEQAVGYQPTHGTDDILRSVIAHMRGLAQEPSGDGAARVASATLPG